MDLRKVMISRCFICFVRIKVVINLMEGCFLKNEDLILIEKVLLFFVWVLFMLALQHLKMEWIQFEVGQG